MKKYYLFVLLLSIASVCFSQTTDSVQYVIDKYIVEGRSATYVSLYDMPGLSQKEIKDLVIKKLSTDPKLSIIQASISDDQIEGSFKDLPIDFRKYGYKWGNVALWILHPASASFTIQFKENKYRVVLKGIKTTVATNSMEFNFNNDFVNKSGKLSAVDKDNSRRSYYSFGKTMDGMFDVRTKSKNDW